MAKYTTTIYRLQLNGFDFGLKNYPIFDESYRPILNKKILDHYLMDEIGLETAALFKHYLNTRMAEIMPKYNILYKGLLQMSDNWDGNVNLKKTSNLTEEKSDTKNTTGSSTQDTNTTSAGNGRSLSQDTPQGQIKTTKTIDDASYATNLGISESTSSDQSTQTGSGTTKETGNGNRTENYVESLIGNNGKKYTIELFSQLSRDIMSVDLMVIQELKDLFMGVY